MIHRRRTLAAGLAACVLLLCSGCPSPEKVTTRPPAAAASKEALYQEGHRAYALRQMDSAATLLQRAYALDSSYAAPVQDLASLYYERAMGEKEGEQRTAHLKQARRYFAALDRMAAADATVYERLCQISLALNDERGFLLWARRNAERFPFDRQYYNLGIAGFNAGEYASTVKWQREAIEKFPQSPYIGGYYRQMGRAYQKLDRDQTAAKVFTSGLEAVNARLEALRKAGGAYRATEGYSRLLDDKIGMLNALRKLYQTYRDAEKLRLVEEELKKAEALR